MPVTLKDLLPGIIGLVVGGVSPQAGRAGATTLEMMDALKQRKRSQALEDERMVMAREDQGMQREGLALSREASARAAQSAEYAATQEQERVGARTTARATAGEILPELKGLGLTSEEEAALLNAETPGNVHQIADEVRLRYKKTLDETPVDYATAIAIGKTLDDGVYQQFHVRYPPEMGGGTGYMSVSNGNSRSGGTLPSGTSSMVTGAYNIQDKAFTLEQLDDKWDEEATDQVQSAREENKPIDTRNMMPQARKTGPNGEVLGTGVNLGNEWQLDMGSETRAIESGQQDIMQAFAEWISTGQMRPGGAQAFMAALSNGMLTGLSPESMAAAVQAGSAPNPRTGKEVVPKQSAKKKPEEKKKGQDGAAYGQSFITTGKE